MNNNIAIITARGGSKRIPRKNIKNFLGQPIIKYSIDAALNSDCFDEVIVSTDDLEIAEYAKKCGAHVPFIRSKKNSDDYSTTADVLLEVIDSYKKLGRAFENACCIYPTAPFVSSEKLEVAFNKLTVNKCDVVLPIVRISFPILHTFKLDNELIKWNWPEYMNTRSQDMASSYQDAAQFYFFNVERFLITKKLFTDNTIGIEIPESEAQDIDNEEDWKIAEIKYTFLNDKLKKL